MSRNAWSTFFNFRQRLIGHRLDEVLVDRTVQLARADVDVALILILSATPAEQ